MVGQRARHPTSFDCAYAERFGVRVSVSLDPHGDIVVVTVKQVPLYRFVNQVGLSRTKRIGNPDTEGGPKSALAAAAAPGKKCFLVDETTVPKNGDQVELLVLSEAADPAHVRLIEQGWRLVEEIGAIAGADW